MAEKPSQRARHWAITLWTEKEDFRSIENWLRRNDMTEEFMIGPEQTTNFKKPHRHVYYKTKNQIRLSPFFNRIVKNHWIKPISEKYPGQSILQAVSLYKRYLNLTDEEKAQDAPQQSEDESDDEIQSEIVKYMAKSRFQKSSKPLPVTSKRIPDTKQKEILQKIRAGVKMSQLLNEGYFHNQVVKLMRYRPPRNERTSVIYLYGPPGVGKTMTVIKCLQEFTKSFVDMSYYTKMSGLSKWWDGYDNQEIVYIDDPAHPKDGLMHEDAVNALLMVCSMGDTIVEIKHGNMVFDSKIVIITSNMPPEVLANMAGPSNDAILRRLTGSCGAFHVDSRVKARSLNLKMFIISCLIRACDCIELSDEQIKNWINNWEPIVEKVYDDLAVKYMLPSDE